MRMDLIQPFINSADAVFAALYVFCAYAPKYGPNMYFVNLPKLYLKLLTELS